MFSFLCLRLGVVCRIHLPVPLPTWGTRAFNDDIELQLTYCSTECHSRFPQSSHQLRCSTSLVPTHRPRYRPPHQEGHQYPNPELCVTRYLRLTTILTFALAIVSAPLWNSKTSRFGGILTSTDFINVIQYYWQFPDEFSKLDQFRLSSLRGRQVSLRRMHR